MSGFTPPPRIKNALDNRKLSMSAATPGHEGKFASLNWSLVNNNPRITVWTNDPTEEGLESKGYGKITANLDLPVFYAFLDGLEEVYNGPNDQKFKIENKGYTFFGGKRSESPVILSELWYGKDKNGVVWVSVSMRDRPKIKFEFKIPYFHQFVKADGTPLSDGESSVLATKAMIAILRPMMVQLAVDNYVEPVKKEQGKGGGNWKGGGQGGGGNRNSGNNNGGGNFDDDIPF